MTRVSHQTIAWCWLIFVAYWFVSALRVKATAQRQDWLSGLAHRIPVTAGALLIWVENLPDPLNLTLTPHGDLTAFIGVIFCVPGLLLAIWSRRTLAGNWSGMVTFKEGHELVQTGPYRFVRHPIYTAMLLMLFGTVIAQGRLRSWLGFLLCGIGFWIKLRQEEALMLQHFPDTYPSYRVRVKALVPFVI